MSGKDGSGVQPVRNVELPPVSTEMESILASVRKVTAPDAIMLMRERPRAVPAISSGVLSLDKALGIGGYPKGRIVEIYGPEGGGKTTLCLHFIAQAQKAGLITAFVDAEHSLDLSYAAALGVQTEDLLLSQPDYGEQALDVVSALFETKKVGAVIVDSVAALTPKAEIDGDMAAHHVATQARLMSQACRKLTGAISRSDGILLFTNQIRSKIGVMFGSPETTSGGNALKFYASVRIDIRRKGAIKVAEEIIGARTGIKVVKNKVAPPFKCVELDIKFGQGFCPFLDLLDLAIAKNIVMKNGAWYSFGDERLGQGRENAALTLSKHDVLYNTIREKLEDACD